MAIPSSDALKLRQSDGFRSATPFAIFATVKTGNKKGKEVVPAVPGKAAYVLGYEMRPDVDMDIYLATGVGHGGDPKQICVTVAAKNTTSFGPLSYAIPLAGDANANVGIVGAVDSQAEVNIWGYYA